MRRGAGFTLLELLVVLAIAGLMASIAIPFTVSTVERAALRVDARELASALRDVRQQAIDRRRVIVVRSLADLPMQDRPRRGRLDAGEGPPLAFYPDGTSSGKDLKLVESGRAVELHVAWLTGAVSVGAPP
jgi:prepilin-type N-terminal cleavage/methylation domain-containing protein